MAATPQTARTNENDLMWVYNPTKTAFTVQWGGYPHRVESGERKIFPRFIATHFAKHLADAILMRKEQEKVDADPQHKPHPMLNHPVERPRVLRLIMLGVYSYHQAPKVGVGDAVARMVEEVQQGVDPNSAPTPDADTTVYEDYGFVENTALGTLDPPEAPLSPQQLDQSLDNAESPVPSPQNTGEMLPGNEPAAPETPPAPTPPAPETPPEPGKQRSLEELRDEATKLGITLKGNENRQRLMQLIQNF